MFHPCERTASGSQAFRTDPRPLDTLVRIFENFVKHPHELANVDVALPTWRTLVKVLVLR